MTTQPNITIVSPIVDTKGKYQPNYKVQFDLEGTVVTKETVYAPSSELKKRFWQEEDFPSTLITFSPQLTAPRLADVSGQEEGIWDHGRETKTQYWTQYAPKGQGIYDEVLVAEALRKVCPEIVNGDYSLAVKAMKIGRNNDWEDRCNEGASWKYNVEKGKLILGADYFADVKENQDETRNEYEIIGYLKPHSAVGQIVVYAEIPSKMFSGSVKNKRISLLHALNGSDLILDQEKGELLGREVKASNLIYQGSSSDEKNSGFRLVYPCSEAVKAAFEYQTNLEQFFKEEKKKVIQALALIGLTSLEAKRTNKFATEIEDIGFPSLLDTLKTRRSNLEQRLVETNGVIGELRNSSYYPQLPEVLSKVPSFN